MEEGSQLRADAGRLLAAGCRTRGDGPPKKKAPPEWGAFFSIIT